ncbi:MAG: hypothetical protein Q7T71_08655 [Herbiconiux sp.]|nr:hypothetical protein [Herbiconiux sp.]
MIGFVHWRGVPQRFDPVLARASYPLVAVAAAASMVYAILRTALAREDIGTPACATAAIVLVVAAAVTVLVVTDPVHTPVRTAGFVAAVTAADLAAVTSMMSDWGVRNVIWDSWAPTVVGVVILCFAQHRSGRDLAAATALSILVVGVTAALESDAMPDLVSPVTAAVITASPVLLFGVAAAAFSYRLSLGQSRAREALLRERSGLSRRVRIRLRGLLRASGRSALAEELVPFLERVLASGTVTEADAVEARTLSAVLRSTIIAEMGLPWLERLQRAHPDRLVVHDEHAVADRFGMEQKVALRGLITALMALPRESAASEPVHVRVAEVGGHRSVFLRVAHPGGEAAVRVRLGTAITVMGAVFARSTVTLQGGELRLVFAAEPERLPQSAPGAPVPRAR